MAVRALSINVGYPIDFALVVAQTEPCELGVLPQRR